VVLIIGGAARTGKGLLSRRLLLETQQPYLSLDVLKMGLVNGLPSFGLDPEASAIAIAQQLWPLVRAMRVNMIETGVHYIVEGEILPEHIHELTQQYPDQIRACFLGYTEITPHQKLTEIRAFGGNPNDWMEDYPDEDILELAMENVVFSRYLRGECSRLGFAYFDTSDRFQEVHEQIIAYLKGGN
jgi:hypothetical protein